MPIDPAAIHIDVDDNGCRVVPWVPGRTFLDSRWLFPRKTPNNVGINSQQSNSEHASACWEEKHLVYTVHRIAAPVVTAIRSSLLSSLLIMTPLAGVDAHERSFDQLSCSFAEQNKLHDTTEFEKMMFRTPHRSKTPPHLSFKRGEPRLPSMASKARPCAEHWRPETSQLSSRIPRIPQEVQAINRPAKISDQFGSHKLLGQSGDRLGS